MMDKWLTVMHTDGHVEHVETTDPIPLHQLQQLVGGYIEIVRAPDLAPDTVLVVNETGLLDNLAMNPIATFLTDMLLVGTVVMCREVMTDDGPDLAGFDEKRPLRVIS